MSFIDENDELANQYAMIITSFLAIQNKIKIEKNGFVPYDKGDYVYTAEFIEGFDRITIEIRREEVVETIYARQTRYFFMGELLTTCLSGERRVPIRNAYHNLMDLMNSIVHMVPRIVLQHIYISIKNNPVFEKIGTFCLCFQFDPRTGETPMNEKKEEVPK